MNIKLKSNTRVPRQERSHRRVEQILETAKAVILEVGCAGLKMSNIADSAGISVGSIYQYFPNKNAIIGALAQRYLEQNRQKIIARMETKTSDLDQLAKTTASFLDHYYELHRGNPVVRQIWMGIDSDKNLQHINHDDSIKNVELIFQKSKHLFPERNHSAVKLMLLLAANFGETAVVTAIELDEVDGKFVMNAAKDMLNDFWDTSVRSLGYHQNKNEQARIMVPHTAS